MLTHEQVIAYLEETLPPVEAAGVEVEFTADAAAATQLTESAQYDSALWALLGGAVERARIEQAVLAAVCGKSLRETVASGLRQMLKQMLDNRSSNPGRHEENNMNHPGKNPDNITKAITKDQMAEQGIPTDLSGADGRQSDRYREDLADEAKWGQGDGKKDTSQKPTPAPEAETQGEDNDYYNGLSQ
jgi:hypothetical protein